MFKIAAKNCPLVLDLNYRGFGLSAECLEWGGELLAVRDPMIPQGDPMPGARVQLGQAKRIVTALKQARLRFPCVIASVCKDDAGWPGVDPVRQQSRSLLDWAKGTNAPESTIDRLTGVIQAAVDLVAPEGVIVIEYDQELDRFRLPQNASVALCTTTRSGSNVVILGRTGRWRFDWRGESMKNRELVTAFQALRLTDQDEPRKELVPTFGRAILA